MFISFIFPYPFGGDDTPYLWTMYKQITHLKPDEVVFIGPAEYFQQPEAFQDGSKWELREDTKMILGYQVPTAGDLASYRHYSLDKHMFASLIQNETPALDVSTALMKNQFLPLELELEAIIESIRKDTVIDGILAWLNCESLNRVARKFGLPVIYNDIGPLQEPDYFSTAYFDLSGMVGKSEARRRFTKFREEIQKSSLPLLSRRELLFLMLNDIYMINSDPEVERTFEIGLPLQAEDDPNVAAYSNGWNNKKLIERTNSCISPASVLVHYLPGVGAINDLIPLGGVDDSVRAIDFVMKCKGIISINSALVLEASLLDRKIQLLGESPFSILSRDLLGNDPGVADISPEENIEAVNFAIIGYLIPYGLLLDKEYYKWRLSLPSELEIYRHHLNHYLNRRSMTIMRNWFREPAEEAMALRRSVKLLDAQSNSTVTIHHHTHFLGNVEAVEWDTKGDLHLYGWAINFIDMSLPDLVTVRDMHGILLATTWCVIPRPDVASAFKSSNVLNSGWDITIPRERVQVSNIEDIKVFAFYRDKNCEYRLHHPRSPEGQIGSDLKRFEENLWMRASGLLPPDRSQPYPSCKFLEGGLIFAENHGISLCCITNLNSTQPYDSIFVCNTNTDDPEFSLKTILKKRKEVIEANQKGGYVSCVGCPQLRTMQWPYRRYLFNYLNLMHFRVCNLRCSFCVVVRNDSRPDTPTDEIVQVLETLVSGEYLDRKAEIAITGGEPAIMEGFDRLLGCLANGEYLIGIASNGTIFSNAIYEALKTGKIDNIVISVDAVTPEIYKLIKGKDLCARVWDNIGKYVESGSRKVIPKMIIMDVNLGDIEGFIQRCVDAGVSSAAFDYDQNTTPDEKIKDGMRRFAKLCKDYGLIPYPAREGLT